MKVNFKFHQFAHIIFFEDYVLQRLRAGADADIANRVLSAKIIIIREEKHYFITN